LSILGCKHCGCTEFERIPRGPHLGVYCKACGQWQKWEKHSENPKTREEYRNEYLDKQPATEQQRIYIRNLLRQNPLSKYQASKIIELLGGEST
jgi:uncharacterized Zn finger protein (UPF0148 family)